MENKKVWASLGVIVIVLIVAIIAIWNYDMVMAPSGNEESTATDTEEMLEDKTSDTSTTQEGGNEISNLGITVDTPSQMATISGATLEVTGQASGWYFEAVFLVELLDGNGNVLATTNATAQGNWMTTNPVPFVATFDLTDVTYTGSAMVVLHKANPSGLPQNDASVSIPVILQ